MFGIIGAMEEEISALRDAIASREVQKIGPITFFTGTLQGKAVVLGKSGVGKINGTLTTALMIENFSPEFIINTGSAGGVGPDQKVGDLVLSTTVFQHDIDVTAFGYLPGQLPGLPQGFPSDTQIIELCEKAFIKAEAAGTFQGHKLHKGPIATGDQFMHDPQRITWVQKTFEPLAVEMEAGGVAQTCHSFGVPFVILRALSDIAGSDSPVDFKAFLAYASENFTKLVSRIIAEA
jgi:adenosylhomocysteine nucleosidase